MLFIFERERECMQRETHTESEVGSKLWAVHTEPDTGLELTNREIMISAKVRCLMEWATWVPQDKYFLKEVTHLSLIWPSMSRPYVCVCVCACVRVCVCACVYTNSSLNSTANVWRRYNEIFQRAWKFILEFFLWKIFLSL